MIPRKKHVLQSSNGGRPAKYGSNKGSLLLQLCLTSIILVTQELFQSFSSYYVRNPKSDRNVSMWKITSMKTSVLHPYSLLAGSLRTQTQPEISAEYRLHLFLSFIAKESLRETFNSIQKRYCMGGFGKKNGSAYSPPPRQLSYTEQENLNLFLKILSSQCCACFV